MPYITIANHSVSGVNPESIVISVRATMPNPGPDFPDITLLPGEEVSKFLPEDCFFRVARSPSLEGKD